MIAPIQDEARLSGEAVGGQHDSANLGAFEREATTMWVLLAVSATNLGLSFWRQRIIR